MIQKRASLPPCWATGATMNNGKPVVLAYTVRQCVTCRRILSWPVLTLLDAFKYTYPHCGTPTEFLEIASKRERAPAVCEVLE